LFHPNKVKNAAAEEINALIKLSHVSPSEFELALQTTIPTERNFFSVVPSVSAAMSDIGFADYSDYVGRVFDLNVKIALVNAQITGDPDSLVNPYYPGPGPSLHSVDTAICMDGPLPDERNFRCLNVISVPTEMVSRID